MCLLHTQTSPKAKDSGTSNAFIKSPLVFRAWQVAGGGDGIIFKVGIPKVSALMKRKPIYC